MANYLVFALYCRSQSNSEKFHKQLDFWKKEDTLVYASSSFHLVLNNQLLIELKLSLQFFLQYSGKISVQPHKQTATLRQKVYGVCISNILGYAEIFPNTSITLLYQSLKSAEKISLTPHTSCIHLLSSCPLYTDKRSWIERETENCTSREWIINYGIAWKSCQLLTVHTSLTSILLRI